MSACKAEIDALGYDATVVRIRADGPDNVPAPTPLGAWYFVGLAVLTAMAAIVAIMVQLLTRG